MPSDLDARGPGEGLTPHLIEEFFETRAVADGEGHVRGQKRKDASRQPIARREEAVARRGDDGSGIARDSVETRSRAHDRDEERCGARELLVVETDDVPREFSIVAGESENLLAARVRFLGFAELGGAADMPMLLDLDELVDDPDVRSIGRGGKGGTHPEGVKTGARLEERFDAVLVEIARGEDLDVVPADGIEAFASPAAVGEDVAGIEPDATRLAAERDDFFDGGADVVGVHEKRRLLGKNIEEVAEGLSFISVGHDPGVSLGAVDGDAEAVARKSVGSAGAAANERGTGGEDAGFDAVSAARAEFHDGAAGCGRSDARGLAGDERLEVEGGKEAGLDKLGFGDRRSNAEKRLVGKEDGAFGESEGVSGEAEVGQVIEELRANMAEKREAAEISDFFGGEADILEEVESLFETRGDEVVAPRWQAAHEELEAGASLEAVLHVARRHSELVQVGEKTGVQGAREHGGVIMPAEEAQWRVTSDESGERQEEVGAEFPPFALRGSGQAGRTPTPLFFASVESTGVAEPGRASVAARRLKMACSVTVTRHLVSVDSKGFAALGAVHVFILRDLGSCQAATEGAERRVTAHVSTGVTFCQ